MSTTTSDESPRAASVARAFRDLIVFGTCCYCIGVIDGKRAAMKAGARQLAALAARHRNSEHLAYQAGRADAALTIALRQ